VPVLAVLAVLAVVAVLGVLAVLEVPALAEAVVELAVPVLVDALVVVPPRSLISFENALLRFERVPADKFEGDPDAAAVLPSTSLLVMS